MKKLLSYVMTVSLILGFAVSCKGPMPPMPEKVAKVNVKFRIGGSFDFNKLQSLELAVTNIETGETQKVQRKEKDIIVPVVPGIYRVVCMAKGDGDKTYQGRMHKLIITEEDLIGGKTVGVILDLIEVPKGELGFVIKEIGYSGNLNTTTKKQYSNAQYFILHNNSPFETLYADSLVFCVTAANCKIPSINKNITSRLPYVGVASMLMIPGNGKSVPVLPGKDLVVALLAQDHSKVSDGPDLSKADFEWGENTEIYPLEDNPNVPNLISLHKESRSFTMLHMRGLNSYFIFKLNMPYKEFLAKYGHEDKYPNPKVPPIMRPYIPDTMIIDGVQLSDGPTIVEHILPKTVDVEHTYCSEMRKGFTIQRKIFSSTINIFGDKTIVLKDTNNSLEDFYNDRPSSLLNK